MPQGKTLAELLREQYTTIHPNGVDPRARLDMAIANTPAPEQVQGDFTAPNMPMARPGNPYDAVLGAKMDISNLGGISDALRRKATVGNVLSLTGDEPLMKTGKMLNDDASTLTGQAGSAGIANRRDDLDRQKYGYQVQADNADRMAKYDTAMLRATSASAKANADGFGKGAFAFGDAVRAGATMLKGVHTLETTFKPEYAQTLAKAMSVGGYVPEAGEDLGKWLQRNTPALLNMTTSAKERESLKQASLWWADMDRLVRTPERSKLYGATLTSNEKEAFQQFLNLSQSMDSNQIVKSMRHLKSVFRDEETFRAMQGINVHGMKPEQMTNMYGDMLDEDSDYYMGNEVGEEDKRNPVQRAADSATSVDMVPMQRGGKPQPGSYDTKFGKITITHEQ